MYKIRWINKQSGYVGIGDVLTKQVEEKDKLPYRIPMDFEEAENLCKFANRNYKRARHVVVEVCPENNRTR